MMSKINTKEKERKFRTLYQVGQKLENISKVDLVDRSGYIPLDVQYSKMMLAGRTREDMLDYQYNYDYKELQDALKDGKITIDDLFQRNFIHRNMEKTELVDILKDRTEKFSIAKREYDKNMQEFHRSEYEKQIRQEAINEYKASLEVNQVNNE